jgi:mRNA interferase RelE/StbE
MQLRAIDRPVALRILEMLSRFGESGIGDVSPLHGEWKGCFRLRCGDHRVIFRRIEGGLEIIAVGHRSELYR